MLIFGHLGIGYKLAIPLKRNLNLLPFFLGALLPDICDKSLYLLCVLITGRHGSDIGLISCTRTFAHTLLFLFILFLFSKIRNVEGMLSLILGILTHLILDCISSYILYPDRFVDYWSVLLWPLLGIQFPSTHYHDVEGLKNYLFNGYLILFECLGSAILIYEYFRKKVNKL